MLAARDRPTGETTTFRGRIGPRGPWSGRPISTALVAAVLAAAAAVAPPAAVAQDGCLAEVEPNDTEAIATPLGSPACVDGTLPSGDQDLAIWEVGPDDVATRWTFTLEGVPGTLTILRFFPVTSDIGQPLAVGSLPTLEVSVPPEGTLPAAVPNVLMAAGRYLVGVGRSGLPGGGEPIRFDYRFSIAPGDPPPAAQEVEPNEDAASGTPVSDAFEIGGDLAGSPYDNFAWTVGETGRRWDLEVQVPRSEPVSITLQSPSGGSLSFASGESATRLYDLALEAGSYVIRLAPSAEAARPYILRAVPSEVDADPEPNDESAHAVPIGDGAPVKGRLARTGDRDRFTLTVPSGDAALRDVRMLWHTDRERRLCLLDAEGSDVACYRGAGGLTAQNLRLVPGPHTFEVSGVEDPDDAYLLRVDATTPAASDFEAEPNDDIELATTVDPSLGMRARGGEGDVDSYDLHVEGEPQLWRIDVAGPDLRGLAYVRRSGQELATGDLDPVPGTVSLTDLYLVPGDHWFRVRAGGEYALQATPLGPPDPDGEREPNDADTLATRYFVGTRRVGRLPTGSDRDLYRFTLAAPQHLRIDLTQPADARTALRLTNGGDLTGEIESAATGQPISWDLLLEPGDHLLELTAEQPSEGEYELTSRRLDPFDLSADQEPNDGPANARPVPASLSWSGDAADASDEDWYVIGPLASPDDLRIHAEGGASSVRLTAPDEGAPFERQLQLTRDEEGSLVVADPPLGVPIHLTVLADAAYTISLEGGGLVPQADPPTPPLEVAWSVAAEPIAAYWPDAQVLPASLELSNSGSEPLELELGTRTSHYLWRVELETDRATVPAGGTVTVPASIMVGADAWARESVLLSARASTPEGGVASGSVELTATAEGQPLGSRPAWGLPDAMLGGLDVASLALGAAPAGTIDIERERRLFDGVTVHGSPAITDPVYRNGFTVRVGDQIEALPLEVIVDLAGDADLPLVGTILNPQAADRRLGEVPRDFELLLSSDGVSWTPALTGRLSPLPIDQPFMLDEPTLASHAMLRITSAYADRRGTLALGEWKVIAAPGTPLASGQLDIADPALGGHVVAMEPFSGDPELEARLLDAETRRESVPLDEGTGLDVILGFRDGRAAQVASIEWLDPAGSNPSERLGSVELQASLLGPLGPWEKLGTWDLARGSDGSVALFTPDEGAWVRYLRLTGQAGPDARAVELPGTLRVLERPTDEGYRSILGEWGYASSRGPYEWSRPPGEASLEVGEDAADAALEATPLAAGVAVVDRVELDVDEDWYAIEVPVGQNSLELTVQGHPTVGVRLSLFDAAGAEQPMAFRNEPDGAVHYQASIEPGAAYRLRVQRPPFSVVFAFDTSDSLAAYEDVVFEGMRAFADDVRPGREVVMVLPFDERPLLESWQDDRYILQDAINRHVTAAVQGSSAVESGLIDASSLLEEREGARAVLLVTDAETTSYDRTLELWQTLRAVRPVIFSAHVGALLEPVATRQRMQDWAASGGGLYTYPSTHGEMDRAFDRMATWLRRPSVYTLEYTTSAVILAPGSLTVSAPTDGSRPGIAPDVGVELILDTSGSMRDRVDGRPRIDVAREALTQLVSEALPEGVPLALRTFGGKGKAKRARCQTRLSVPLAPLDRAAVLGRIASLEAKKGTATPLGAALLAVADDLASVTGPRTVVLVTDGEETCKGDPAAAIEALRAGGLDVHVNIVGFELEDEALKETMASWAELGGGTYFDASGGETLASAIETAVSAPFRVYGPDGEPVADGTVGGEGVALDPGAYRVEVLVDPVVTFREVVIEGGQAVDLTLPPAGEGS